MAIGPTRTQKAKIRQLPIDRFTNEGAGLPTGLHVVVIPGFTSIHSDACCGVDQFGMAQAVSGGMGQNGETSGCVNGLHNGLGTKRFTDDRITTVVRLKRVVIQLEAESQHMHEAAPQQTADLHAAPKGGHVLSSIAPPLQPGPHRWMGVTAVVVGDGEMLQAETRGLFNQCLRLEASVAADGVAVKIESSGTTVRTDLVENRTQRMISSWNLRHRRRLPCGGVSSGHKTESRQP